MWYERTKTNKKKKANPTKIHISNLKRGKKKFLTVIKNVEIFGLDMKEVSKLLSKKFACSSSVSKDDSNVDCIMMTGEFEDDLKDFLLEKFKNLKEENIHIERSKKEQQPQMDKD